jgi:ABC-type bacteriocin/lantibiotic exporter with double-glycine peptidase domain
VKPREEKRADLVNAGREAIGKLNSTNGGQLIAGINDATKLVRPLLYTLLALFALVTVAIVACLLLTATELALKLIVLSTLWCLLLLFILWLIKSQLGKTARIAQGQINGG